jgi:hypothetical protein
MLLPLRLVVFTAALMVGSLAQAPATGIVAGQVIDESTGRPVGGAVVTLTLVAATGQPAIPAAQARRGAAVADTDGRFVFRDVPAGRYTLASTLNGYAPGATGRRRPGGPSAPVTLAEAQRTTDAVVTMWRLASISGTLTDDRGEPAIGISVWALRRVITPGGLAWTTTGGTVEATDDRGHFRLSGLMPGAYTVSVRSSTQSNSVAGVAAWRAAMDSPGLAAGNPFRGRSREAMESGAINIERSGFDIDGWQVKTSIGALQPLPGPEGTVLVHPSTFYGNTSANTEARVITLTAGEDRTGVDMTLSLVVGQRVSGTLFGPTGPAAGHGVRLSSSTGHNVAYSTTDAQGGFVLLGVPAGAYTLRAHRVPVDPDMLMRMTGEQSPPTAGPPAPSLFAELPVSVGAAPVDSIALTLGPGAALAGHVVFDGTTPRPTPEQVGRMTFVLRTLEADAGQARISPSGTFQTPGYATGRYLITVVPPTPVWTLASIHTRGLDVAGQAINLEREDITDLVVTFTDKVITLNGSVSGGGMSVPPDATVVVMPADVNAWVTSGMSPRRVVTTTTTATGAYQMTIPLAGDYLVVAVPPDVAPDVDPEFVARYAAGAVRVSFSAGETRTLPLTLRRPR